MNTPQFRIDRSQSLCWRQQQQWSRGAIPPALYGWLTDRGSLTGRLIEASCGNFKVEVLRQCVASPLPEEARKLGMKPRSRAMIREVLLLGYDRPWVFARSIVPLSTLSGRQKALRNLNNRPLGAFLFADPSMERGPIEIACIAPEVLGQKVVERKIPGQRDSSENLWGRRSMFFLDRKPLLVSEIFLSAFKPLQ